MTKMRIKLIVAVLIICYDTGNASLIQKPQDSSAVIGKSTYFNCSTSEPSKRFLWYHYDVDDVQREAIYRCDNFTEYWYPCYRNGRYVIERNPATGAYNLVIPTVVSSDAGRFQCEVDGDKGMANLTVRVESNPSSEASGSCKPYIDAIICIFVIILPTAIVGTIILLWYQRVYKPKKQKQKEKTGENNKEGKADNDVPQQDIKPLMGTSNDTTDIGRLKLVSDKHVKQIKDLEKKLDSIQMRIKDLEQSLYPSGNIDYQEKPNWLQTVKRPATINGIAILDTELFILHEKYSMIEVYNIEQNEFKDNLKVKGMSHPMDIASCKIANCLYVIILDEKKSESQILKLEPKGKLIKEWLTGGDRGRLSTYKSNVIVCLYEKHRIKEYSSDGVPIHTVDLSSTIGLNHPLHAIKVTGSHFAICHGETKDDQHRVCVVDAQGNIIQELKEWKTKKFNVPICLAQDSERSILVADRINQRVWLINSALKHPRRLLKTEKEFEGYPVRICLDEVNGRLFVATNIVKADKKKLREDRILIFNIK